MEQAKIVGIKMIRVLIFINGTIDRILDVTVYDPNMRTCPMHICTNYNHRTLLIRNKLI